jgi:hypothetical protein
MSKHRRTHTRVSNNADLDNFNPADALESLRADMMGVEALAHAAGEAVVHLPFPSNAEQRRAFARIYTLVTKAAAEASTALSHGDALISALTAQREARRVRRELDPPSEGI